MSTYKRSRMGQFPKNVPVGRLQVVRLAVDDAESFGNSRARSPEEMPIRNHRRFWQKRLNFREMIDGFSGGNAEIFPSSKSVLERDVKLGDFGGVRSAARREK